MASALRQSCLELIVHQVKDENSDGRKQSCHCCVSLKETSSATLLLTAACHCVDPQFTFMFTQRSGEITCQLEFQILLVCRIIATIGRQAEGTTKICS